MPIKLSPIWASNSIRRRRSNSRPAPIEKLTYKDRNMRYFALLLVLFAANTAAAASFDAPKRKSGLWELKISSGQTKGSHAMQQCIDEKTDDLMKKEMGENQKTQCSKNEMRKEGDKIVAESVCKLENSTAKTRAVFTGTFDSTYKAAINTTYEPRLREIKKA